MGTWKEYIEAKKAEWIGRRVRFEGRAYTVVGVDYNAGILIDKADRFKKDTAVHESMVEILEENGRETG